MNTEERKQEAQRAMERIERNIITVLHNVVSCQNTECDLNINYAKSMLRRLQGELDGFKIETKIKYEI